MITLFNMLTYLLMKVTILQPKGYCAGVARAIDIALKARKEHLDKNVYVLGMLVHNHHVSNLLKEHNITIVNDFEAIEDESVIVFNADGHTKEQYQKALDKHLIIYNAICPKVENNLKKIHQENKNGHQVIYIGQKNHQETQIALASSSNIVLYDDKEGIDWSKVNDESPFVLNQTTLNSVEIVNLYNDIKNHYPEARISNEICPTTRKRQEAVQLIKEVDAIIVVGDQVSSNSKRLFEIASTFHPGVFVCMVSDYQELPLEELTNKNHIAISSGASTPSDVIDVIYNKIISL